MEKKDSFEEYIKNNSNNKKGDNFAISIDNLFFKYSKKQKFFTINNCSFNISFGSFHAFIGENGSGKTTIIKIICGANKKYSGDVFIKGKSFLSDKSARLPITYIPTKPEFPNEFNVYDFLYVMGSLVRNDIEQLKKEIDEYLTKFDLNEIRNKKPSKLSSGQQQKILLIKSILEKAEIYILDEPTANLDPTSRLTFFNVLNELVKINKITVFISSHSMEEIRDYVNEATFIKKGSILYSGKINGKDLVNKYKELFLQNVLNSN